MLKIHHLSKNLHVLLYHLSALTFTLLCGHHLLFERQISTKLRAGKHSADHPIIQTQLTVIQD
jgi:hypothetical protein